MSFLGNYWLNSLKIIELYQEMNYISILLSIFWPCIALVLVFLSYQSLRFKVIIPALMS